MSEEFEMQGIDVTVMPPPGKELQKTSSGFIFDCDCGTAKIKITKEDIITGGELGSGQLDFQHVVAARKAAEIRVKAPIDNFAAWCTENQKAEKVGIDKLDVFETPVSVSCPICKRRYAVNVRFENPTKFTELTLLEAVKKIPLKLDTFTRKALARLAMAQGYITPEKFVEEVNGLLSDIKAIDALQSALNEVATKFELKSTRGMELINMLRDDIRDIPNATKEIEKQLTDMAQQIYDASWVTFAEDDNEKKDSFLQKAVNKLTGNDGVLLVAEKGTKP